VQAISPEGYPYFSNAALGITQWTAPTGAEEPGVPPSGGGGESEAATAAPQLSLPLPRGWAEARAPSGHTYFLHAGRGISQWEHPASTDGDASPLRSPPLSTSSRYASPAPAAAVTAAVSARQYAQAAPGGQGSHI